MDGREKSVFGDVVEKEEMAKFDCDEGNDSSITTASRYHGTAVSTRIDGPVLTRTCSQEPALNLVPSPATTSSISIASTANSLGLHDAMRFGTRSLAAEVAPKHPLETRLGMVRLHSALFDVAKDQSDLRCFGHAGSSSGKRLRRTCSSLSSATCLVYMLLYDNSWSVRLYLRYVELDFVCAKAEECVTSLD